MCHPSIFLFFINHVKHDEFQGKNVLEVGSRFVNMSIRPFIEKYLNPKNYVGVDIEQGKFVDLVLSAENLVEHFGEESFDVVISTEMLEHVKDWRLVINNLKMIIKEGGYLFITTRSRGFKIHGYPFDFWRYNLTDMKEIFRDFDIIVLKNDTQYPGVFLKARKKSQYKSVNLDNFSLYSVILDKRTKLIPDIENEPLRKKIKRNLYGKLRNFYYKVLEKHMSRIKTQTF